MLCGTKDSRIANLTTQILDIDSILLAISLKLPFLCPSVKKTILVTFSLQFMCDNYTSVMASIPKYYHTMVIPSLMKINRVLEPGMVLHNWSSVGNMKYMHVS